MRIKFSKRLLRKRETANCERVKQNRFHNELLYSAYFSIAIVVKRHKQTLSRQANLVLNQSSLRLLY